MRTARVTLENGHTWETAINGTDESIQAYYLGEEFNVLPYNEEGKEEFVKCVKVEVFDE